VIDPVERTVDVHRPGHPSVQHRPPERMHASPVLAAFELDLAALFALLDRSPS
jgi:hypothetical protein